MMNGNLNLYRPELLPRPVELNTVAILKILGLMCAAMLLIWLLGTLQIHRIQTAIVAAQQEQMAAQQQLADYDLRYPPILIEKDLQLQVEAAEHELRGKNRMMKLIEGGKNQKTPGFARYMAGLGRQHINGLWLENIEVHTRGELVIGGSVMDASVLPVYLERLSIDSAFSDYRFQTFQLLQPGKSATTANAAAGNAPPPAISALHFELRATSTSAAGNTPDSNTSDSAGKRTP